MCHNVFDSAMKIAIARRLDCPVRMFPRCHPKAHCEVFVNPRKREIVLTCSKCDRPITTIKARHDRRRTKGNSK